MLADRVVFGFGIDIETASTAFRDDECEARVQDLRDRRAIDVECHGATEQPRQACFAMPIRNPRHMHQREDHSDLEATHARSQDAQREGEHIPEAPLMSKFVHLFDSVEPADSGGPCVVEVVLAKSAVARIEIGDRDPAFIRRFRSEDIERLRRAESQRIVEFHRLGLLDEGREFLGRRKWNVAREKEHFGVEFVGTRITAFENIAREHATIGLPGVGDQIALLWDDVERLAKRTLDPLGTQRGLQPVRIADDPDRVDFRAILKSPYHMGNERQTLDFEIDLALTVHRLGRTAVARGDDRRNAQCSVSFRLIEQENDLECDEVLDDFAVLDTSPLVEKLDPGNAPKRLGGALESEFRRFLPTIWGSRCNCGNGSDGHIEADPRSSTVTVYPGNAAACRVGRRAVYQ